MIPAPTQDAGTSPAEWHETCLGNRDWEAVNLGANDFCDFDGFLKMGDRAKTLVSRIIRIFNRVCLPTLGFTQGWVPTKRRNGQHFRNFQVCTSMFLETLEWVECFFFNGKIMRKEAGQISGDSWMYPVPTYPHGKSQYKPYMVDIHGL